MKRPVDQRRELAEEGLIRVKIQRHAAAAALQRNDFPSGAQIIDCKRIPAVQGNGFLLHESLQLRLHHAAEKIEEVLSGAGIRVTTDARSEKIGYKIREAQLEKIPYMLVLGDKEAENGVVAVRKRGEGDVGQMTPDELLAKLREEIRTKAR